MEPIEWHRGLAESRAGRLLAYLVVAVPAGLVLLFAGALVLVLPAVAGSLLANPALLALVVLLALVGGPVSLLYLWPLLTDPDQRRGLVTDSWVAALPRACLAVATLLAFLAHVAALFVRPEAPLVLAAAGPAVGALGTGLLLTRGRVDPEARTLTVAPTLNDRESGARTVDIEAWTDLAVYRLGPVALLRPSYAPGTSGDKPRLLAIPTWVAEEAEPVFAAGVEAPTPERERDSNPIVALALVSFGLGFGAVAAAVWLLRVGPDAFRAWFAAVFGVFAALFLAVGWRER